MTIESNPITAIVLASGLGTRFGGDKLLKNIPYDENLKLPIGLISALNIKPHVDNVICIVRPNDLKLKQLFQVQGFHTVDNPDFEQGLSSSIKAGILACQENNHYLICLGDMPYIQANTYQASIAHFLQGLKTRPNTIVRPVLKENNKAGHPVIFSNTFKGQLLNLVGDDGGKPVIKQNGFSPIAVNDKGILEDIDRPTDIRS